MNGIWRAMGVVTLSSMIENSQKLVIVAIILALAGCSGAAQAGTYKGRAITKDADSIYIDEKEIRLFGVDAPEARQTCSDAAGATYACGQRARAWLAELIGKQSLECDDRGRDDFGRILSVCRIGKVEINRAFVESGWAVAYRWRDVPTMPEYVPVEASARAARRGLWAGEFVMPWKWRAAHKRRP